MELQQLDEGGAELTAGYDLVYKAVFQLELAALEALGQALADAFGVDSTVTAGQGGSIPLCSVFQEVNPDAEIVLMGCEEPEALIHAPNESVSPREIEHLALGEALFLTRLGAATV